jgi:NADPH:quinone reductase-like Zn-dependent oxidoreductase
MNLCLDSPRVLEVIDTRAELPLSARLRLRTQARADLAPTQVRIGMLAMSILPADLLQLSGQYGVQPPLPYVPGHEGVAVVLEVGTEVTDLAVGQRVLPMGAGGLWADECVMHRRALLPVAGDGDVLQQAMLTANPATAWVLLKHEGGIAPGQWLIQNAANSAVGQCVRLLAAHLGLNLINIVRRPQAIDASDGGHWLVDEGQEPAALRAQVRAIAGEGAIVLALDAIGGSATESLAACLDEGARLLLYGLLGGQSSRIAAHDLVFRGLQVRGFWLARWFGDPAHRQIGREVYPALLALAEQGVLRMAVEQVYDLDQWLPALAHACQSGRQGKILLRGAHGYRS